MRLKLSDRQCGRPRNQLSSSAARENFQKFADARRQSACLLHDAHAGRFAPCLFGEPPVGDERRALRGNNERSGFAGKSGEVIPACWLRHDQRAEFGFVELFSQRAAALCEWSRHKRIEETVVSSIWP